MISFAFFIWAVLLLFAQVMAWVFLGEWVSIPAAATFFHNAADYPKLINFLLPSSSLGVDIWNWMTSPSLLKGPQKVVLASMEFLNVAVFIFLVSVGFFILANISLSFVEICNNAEKAAKKSP